MAASNQIVVSGAREHNLKDISLDAAARRAGRHHRPVGVGQVLAGLRHDLRGGTAPVRRVAVRLRPAVPGPDGQARRRLDRGPLAGHLDRPEDDLAQPALHGGHGDRDLRLPATAVVARRSAALPDLRPPDRGPVGRADHRPGDGARRRNPLHGAGPGGARAQGRVRQAARGPARRRLRPREGRRRAAPARGGLRLDKKFKHDMSVVVDRLVMRHDLRKRLADSIETAVALADGLVEIELMPARGRLGGRRAARPRRSRRPRC